MTIKMPNQLINVLKTTLLRPRAEMNNTKIGYTTHPMYKTAASVQQPNSPHPMRRIIYSTYGNIHLVPELRHMSLTNYFFTCSQSFVICSADSLSLLCH